ncbi:hypothetical protein Tco_1043456 [Tanacetum coccineum]|uniref:Uncharacterized protein n=1 Tax=Tanacetum coccineum TaxID=301880 RepID=A0ABQ5GM60_9ASTR
MIEQFWATVKVKTVNGEVQIQALVDKKKVIITKTSIRRDLQLADENGTECLPNATIFAELKESWGKKKTKHNEHTRSNRKLVRYITPQEVDRNEAAPAPRHAQAQEFQDIRGHQDTLTGAKTTAWNEFSSTMASTVIWLATNQKFNFSKYIFDNMVKNLEGGVKFIMYSRFVQVFLDKQVEGMSKHKEIYVTPSHNKKVVANMKSQGSGMDTPLFPTMIVQAQQQVGEGSEVPTDSHHTPTTIQPSISKPQKIQSRRKQRKDNENPQLNGPIEHVTDDTENVASVPTHSNDPQLSGEDRLKLNFKRVKKLEGKRKSKPSGMKRLFKIGRSARVVSSKDEGLGDQEDASKQGRKINEIDQDAEVDMAEKDASTEKEVSTADLVITVVDELTLAQTLIEIKVAKPKVVTTAATTTIIAIAKPKARGVIVQEPS